MVLHGNIVGIEIPDGIYPLTFVADDFTGLFLHSLIFSIKHSRYA